MDRDELAAWLRLSLTPGVGSSTARKLLAALGSPQSIFTQGITTLGHLVNAAQAQALLCEPAALAPTLQATLDWLDGADGAVARRVFVLGDPLYPQSLLAIEDPPIMLYMTGSLDRYAQIATKNIATDIAVVGSRNPTPQGLTNAQQFARSFANAGLNVVSGLALGIDGAAHRGALDAVEAAPASAGCTIAVVGTGLDRVYPKRHYELAHRIVQNGVILSEFPIGSAPLAANFPQRNRLISALTQGTLVVEAAVQSGSLITARLAAEQGKEVFAVPGSIHSPQSKGCHLLIKQGAKLVESAQDVMEELKLPPAIDLGAVSAYSTGLKGQFEPEIMKKNKVQSIVQPCEDHPDERILLQALGHDPVSLDALIARTGIDAPALQARLMALELADQVVRLPGGLFQRQMAG